MNQPVQSHWGPHAVWISLPALTIRLTGLSKDQLSSLIESYPGCITEQEHEPTEQAVIECSAYRLQQPVTIPARALSRAGQYTPRQIRHQDNILITGCNFRAQFALNPANPVAALGVAEENELSQANVIENFLRIYAAYHTLRQGGLVLHSAGLVFAGQAYIFPGKSNAGKTTLARKAYQRKSQILSDDINLLLPAAQGYQAHAVPFTGEFGRTLDYLGTGREAYPVAGIILLKQAKQLSTETVRPSIAVAALLAGCPFVNTDEAESDALFNAVIRLATKLPVIRLSSCRDDTVGAIMTAVTRQLDNRQERT